MDVTGGAESSAAWGSVQRDQSVSNLSMGASGFCLVCSGGVAAALHWVSFDDVHARIDRPSRVDPQGRLVWAHAMTKRSYRAVSSAFARSGMKRSARASVGSCFCSRRARVLQRRPSLLLSPGSRGVVVALVATGSRCGQRCQRHRWLLRAQEVRPALLLSVQLSASPLAVAVKSARATSLAGAGAGAVAVMSLLTPLTW